MAPADILIDALVLPRLRPLGVERMLDTDVNTYLPADLLVKMDIATMAYSVEARSPFLDHQLMEFAAALPANSSCTGCGKVLLKSALRGILPDESWIARRWASEFPSSRGSARARRICRARCCSASDTRVHALRQAAAIIAT